MFRTSAENYCSGKVSGDDRYFKPTTCIWLSMQRIIVTFNLTSSSHVAYKPSTLSLTSSVGRCSGHVAPAFSLLLCCSPLCCPRSTPLPVPSWCPPHWSPTVIVISFPHLSDERSPSPSEILAEVSLVSHLRYFFIDDAVLPAYLKYSSKASVLEDLDLIFVAFVHLPCLATIHQDWFNQSYIVDFGSSADGVRAPDLPRSHKHPSGLTTLLWMYCVPPPSLETVAPRYTNFSISWPLPIHVHRISYSIIYS